MMKRNKLGRTGIEVSELCFGALPFGPIQKNVDPGLCAGIVAKALESGVNFIDTAQMYRTYEPIRAAMKATGIRPVIATKSTAKDYEGMEKAIHEALRLLDVDNIDIFHLHAARAGAGVLLEREGALRCLTDYRKAGVIRAAGISTHSVQAVCEAAENRDIDVVFPIINITGTGILHGTKDDMEQAIAACIAHEKGVYLMKALGGGCLIDRYDEAMKYARGIPGAASVAVGMVSDEELGFNLEYFTSGGSCGRNMPTVESSKKRFIVVRSLCNNCGACRTTCPNEAICENSGISVINDDACLTCGYCVAACPQFAIRMV